MQKWARAYGVGNKPIDLTPDDYAVYADILKSLSVGQLEAACRRAGETCKFFPRPADIFGFVEGAVENLLEQKAEKNWQVLMHWIANYYHPDVGVVRGAPVIPPKVDHACRAAGGFELLSICTHEELVWAKKRFVEDFERQYEFESSYPLLPDSEVRKLLAQAAESLSMKRALPSPDDPPRTPEAMR